MPLKNLLIAKMKLLMFVLENKYGNNYNYWNCCLFYYIKNIYKENMQKYYKEKERLASLFYYILMQIFKCRRSPIIAMRFYIQII